MFQSGLCKHPTEADILLLIEPERVLVTDFSLFVLFFHLLRFKGARLGSGTRPRRARCTLLPSDDGKCVETTQGTTDGSNPSARGAFRAAILQRFSLDNKSFDRPGTASMRHTSKASGGILSSHPEMNDSTSCYHAITAVCHGCTAIDEILQSWIYRKQIFKPRFAYG